MASRALTGCRSSDSICGHQPLRRRLDGVLRRQADEVVESESAARRRPRAAGSCSIRSVPLIAAGTRGTPAASAMRAEPWCARGVNFFRSPFCLSRAFREHGHDLALLAEAAPPSRSPGCRTPRVAPGTRPPAREERREHRVEELRLAHEVELLPGPEREAERPGIEVRRVVGGKDGAALRHVLDSGRAQPVQPVEDRPAEGGGEVVKGRRHVPRR